MYYKNVQETTRTLTVFALWLCLQELVRLPVAPLSSNPDGVPGFALLLNSYTDRMDETMTQWYKSIVSQVSAAVGGWAREWMRP
jgi:hypothetical protein